MNAQQQIPVRQSIKTKFSLFIVLLVLVALAGEVYWYQFSKRILYKELQSQGIWIAHTLASHVRHSVFSKEHVVLNEMLEEKFFKNELTYLVILDADDNILLSRSKNFQEEFTPPSHIRHITCETGAPVTTKYSLKGEGIYDMAIRIAHQDETSLYRSDTSDTSDISEPACLGVIHIGMSLKGVNKQLNASFLVAVLILTVIGGIGGIGFWRLSRMMLSPILKMSEVAVKISEGDLRQIVTISSDNEIGMLEVAVSRILKALNTVATRLRNASEQIKITSDEILNISEKQSSNAQRQLASIYQISRTVEDAANSSKRIADNADDVANGTESTLKSTQEMEKTVRNTVSRMGEIRDQVGKNTERVMSLGEKISQIDNVVKIINTIADQTKLIGFNASIEAVGAGENGGRFSVVATEVRRLANTVVESVGEIKNSVSSIQTATSELILSSETGIRKVNQGASLIAEIGNTLQHIMAVLEETTQAAKEISISMQQQQAENEFIVDGINALSSHSERSLDVNKRAHIIVKELRTLADELDATVQEFLIE